jgi:hypothetical protein
MTDIPRSYNSKNFDASPEGVAAWAAEAAASVRLTRNNHAFPEAYALGWERGVRAVTRMFQSLAKR